MQTFTKRGHFVVRNDKGLHTRPATELVRCANRFSAKVTLEYQDKQVSAKSILSVLTLTASKGAEVHICAEGDDAEQAIQSIIELAEKQFYLQY